MHAPVSFEANLRETGGTFRFRVVARLSHLVDLEAP